MVVFALKTSQQVQSIGVFRLPARRANGPFESGSQTRAYCVVSAIQSVAQLPSLRPKRIRQLVDVDQRHVALVGFHDRDVRAIEPGELPELRGGRVKSDSPLGDDIAPRQ